MVSLLNTVKKIIIEGENNPIFDELNELFKDAIIIKFPRWEGRGIENILVYSPKNNVAIYFCERNKTIIFTKEIINKKIDFDLFSRQTRLWFNNKFVPDKVISNHLFDKVTNMNLIIKFLISKNNSVLAKTTNFILKNSEIYRNRYDNGERMIDIYFKYDDKFMFRNTSRVGHIYFSFIKELFQYVGIPTIFIVTEDTRMNFFQDITTMYLSPIFKDIFGHEFIFINNPDQGEVSALALSTMTVEEYLKTLN